MSNTTSSTAAGDKSPKDTFDELRTMVVDYAKQETVDPLKNLGKWVGFGIGGALMIAIGAIMFALGLLRLLQTQTGGWFDGEITSSLPYFVTLLAVAVIIGLTVRAMLKRPEWLDAAVEASEKR